MTKFKSMYLPGRPRCERCKRKGRILLIREEKDGEGVANYHYCKPCFTELRQERDEQEAVTV